MADEETDLTDVSLLLVAQMQRADRVSLWLGRIAGDPRFTDTPLVVLLPDGMAADAIELPAGNPDVRLVQIPETDDDFASLMAEVATTYIAAIIPPGQRKGYLKSLHRDLVAIRGMWGDIDATIPLLLANEATPLQVLGPYLSWFARRSDGTSLARFGAGVAARGGVATVEGIDPAAGSIDLLLRLNLGPTSFSAPPNWRFSVALVGPDGEVAQSDQAELTPRSNRYATERLESLQVRLPISHVPSGEYRLTLRALGTTEASTVQREIRPSTGTLQSARTELVEHRGSVVRYLAHTRGNGRSTRLTIHSGTGAITRWSWAWRLFKKDLRFILNRRDDRQMRALRLVRLVTAPLCSRRGIWLIGERSDTAQDNGFHLFHHLRTHHPRRRVYYVIDDDSRHAARVRPLGNVVRHSSVKHQLLMLHAKVLADAYSIHYLIPRQWDPANYARRLAWRVGALRVYLKHGVHLSPHAVRRGSTGYDVLLTVNNRESEALRSLSGYSNQIAEVGLPRYDALTPTQSSRTILFMSTWRRYLVPKLFGGATGAQVEFSGTTYERFISDFLTDPRLHSILETYDYTLRFLPHYNVAEHFRMTTTAGPRITLADVDQVSFQDLLRECDAFITDYSSVQFDIAYLGTPTIYTHFDRAEYDSGHAAPSWFDFERDGFGPVTHTKDELLDELEELLARGCARDPIYAARAKAAFTYRDQSNCNRAVEVIDARLDG